MCFKTESDEYNQIGDIKLEADVEYKRKKLTSIAADVLYSTNAQPRGSFWAFRRSLTSSNSPENKRNCYAIKFCNQLIL